MMPDSREISEFRALCQEQGMLPEHIIQGLYRALLAPTDTAVDCGAHKGFHTRPMAECCSNGHVVAFEGLPHLAEQLVKRFEKRPNVVVRNCAIQDDPELTTLQFQYVADRPGRSGINSATINTGGDNEYSFELLEVRASTVDAELDALGTKLDSVKFVKLDLEGGEFAALRGMSRVLKEGQPVVAFENGFHAASRGGYNEQDVQDFFADLGFATFTIFGEQFETPNHDFWYAFAAPTSTWRTTARLVDSLRIAAIERSSRMNAT